MIRRMRRLSVLLALLVGMASVGRAADVVIYGFEEGIDHWVIPDWAKTSNDYVGKTLAVTDGQAEEGRAALELQTDFPGERWTGAYAECPIETTDWSPFRTLLVSVYLPPTAPVGLKGRIILTVGGEWRWTEQNRGTALQPGQWSTLQVNLTSQSVDWKFFPSDAFRKDIRKLGVRIESDKAPVYQGPVLIDNVRLAE